LYADISIFITTLISVIGSLRTRAEFLDGIDLVLHDRISFNSEIMGAPNPRHMGKDGNGFFYDDPGNITRLYRNHAYDGPGLIFDPDTSAVTFAEDEYPTIGRDGRVSERRAGKLCD
jgi:hypothetical protein